ncbi:MULTISPECIES: hypothetical protein [Dethiosulfovibrio]|uniref:Uncharacterized protein n=2 Tax=Dethiosulfovibrio TaxID=47054 RepID=A0ABS9ER88_9BACT|nr:MULTISPECIES: hypothetical protein [Dethiosulfovibrio]MCF4115225.1 hypothetical protein [Dethiosulfovibrio russensis]MCF4143689.1 hypothetical protein [Dethiosulfovibrio marinus]
MAVKRIDTLGCHPLVLMKKLAAIGGLEILKEEKHVHDGVEYPYHIVAKVKDGLYVEAKDPIYEFASTPELLPRRVYLGELEGDIMALEASSTMLGIRSQTDYMAPVINSQTPLPEGPMGLSILFSYFGKASNTSSYRLHSGAYIDSDNGYLFGAPLSRNKEKVMRIGGKNPISNLDLMDKSNGIYVSVNLLTSDTLEYSYNGTSAVVMSAFIENIQWKPFRPSGYRYYATPRIYFGQTTEGLGAPIVISGTIMRIGTDFLEDQLVSPTSWRILPITSSVISNEGGVFFCYDEGEEHSGVLGLVLVDTSKGNGLDGPFPAIFDTDLCCAFSPPSKGEHLVVLGSESNPEGIITMQLFAPSPPISTDSVSGGPVVTDLFAYTSEEIRGAVPGVLATPEALAVGSVGWLDGKRYRVHLPGRMLQIG